MLSLRATLTDLDTRLTRAQIASHTPGVAWGVVLGGDLIHSGGAGTTRDGIDRRPDADTIFRIASMTKSFTAATILSLRDEGSVELDAPVARYVPELRDWAMPTRDSLPVTIRQLLTMSSGLPTDDPWGDRQQELALDRFSDLLRSGPTFAWPPGTTFEYSNLGYGILGRVITNITGQEYRDVVRDQLFRPLAMDSSAFQAEDLPEDRLAHGYIRRTGGLIREGTDGYGALASMGGVYSTVRDLARWVSGFLEAFPARDDPEGSHPLRRSSRREMQQIHRADLPGSPARAADAQASLQSAGYGFGLAVTHDLELGTIVGHAGGYPGFGSHMAWHPATGFGLIGLGNQRYAPMRPAVADALAALIRSDAVPRRSVVPSAPVETFRPVVEGLLEAWSDDVADDVFAMNMDLDEPRDLRRATFKALADEAGPLTPDDPHDPTLPAPRSASPADLTWWLRGRRSSVRLSILITPEPSPRIQSLSLERVGEPSPALRALAERVLEIAADPTPAAVDALGLVPTVGEALHPAIRAAVGRWGEMRLGRPSAGDGTSSSTFELKTDRGEAELEVAIDPETGSATSVALRDRAREAPAESW